MKKILMSLFVGILAVSVVACGGKTNLKSTENNTTQESKVATTSKNTDLFVGDSLLKGLPEFAGKENVISVDGTTVQFVIEQNMKEILDKKPENLYLLLGLNDLSFPVKDPVKKEMNEYEKLIKQLKEKAPQMKIHILSLPSGTSEALKKNPQYKNIPTVNKNLEELAKKENVQYVDLSSLLKEKPDLYGEDGIHFKKEFYPILLEKIKK
ncbi:GDSL-like Lipase/Acylhydrolase [Thermoactinomyces sp. DSM 45891]|uniref:GDSL-type esterase/lipase family protein n=1 Tax=Thermoactinomyces sp. DSM 45891 TaxID=1761907 RepID=UPI00091D3D2D|nr:GDSL-type esterase/lipase family protein [Thermoactinomyces sp. DSM 45891]SFX01342.1 GDSL-like Lipase/Acylhydrolase [Thermoactinomyces sp. DSM 45891]